MKSSTTDKVEGKIHQAVGAVKEAAGRVIKDRELEAEGQNEKLEGKIQEKIVQVKKIAGK